MPADATTIAAIADLRAAVTKVEEAAARSASSLAGVLPEVQVALAILATLVVESNRHAAACITACEGLGTAHLELLNREKPGALADAYFSTLRTAH